MAIPCNSAIYGSSPYQTSMYDFTSMQDEWGMHKFDQDPSEFKPDIFDMGMDMGSSIQDGISRLYNFDYSLPSSDILNGVEADVNKVLRYTDCMWSGPNTSVLSTSASSGDSLMLTASAVPLAAVTNSLTTSTTSVPSPSANTMTAAPSNGSPPHLATAVPPALLMATQIKKEIKEEPTDDYEQQLQQHSIRNSRNALSPSNMQNIPAGTSLLRKTSVAAKRQQSNSLAMPKSSSIPIPTSKAAASSSLKFTSNSPAAAPTGIVGQTSSALRSFGRPDTPHSLDDDVPELKHDIDLRACVTVGNSIALGDDPAQYINCVSKDLQDMSKDQIQMTCLTGPVSLNEVTEVIMRGEYDESDDDEEMEDYDDEDHNSSSCASMLEDGDAFSVHSRSSHGDSNIRSLHHNQQPYHSDHSYTRCKDGGIGRLVDNLETPSETDEEIDVVTINDRKLPTNPSDFDRRAIQTKVAHKFSHERIVKNANGVRTLAPRRRSYLQYTPVSNNSPVKSVNNSRFPSPIHTPYPNAKYHHQQQQQEQQLYDEYTNALGTVMQTAGGDKLARKRVNVLASSQAKKANRNSKKICLSAQTSMVGASSGNTSSSSSCAGMSSGPSTPNGLLKRHYSLDEADTIEKRNLHNDMERQRRIGLKNLFESLKKQIPNLKDKERAPKVNILREAAKLCESLTREEAALSRESEKLDRELRRREEHLARLKASLRVK